MKLYVDDENFKLFISRFRIRLVGWHTTMKSPYYSKLCKLGIQYSRGDSSIALYRLIKRTVKRLSHVS